MLVFDLDVKMDVVLGVLLKVKEMKFDVVLVVDDVFGVLVDMEVVLEVLIKFEVFDFDSVFGVLVK